MKIIITVPHAGIKLPKDSAQYSMRKKEMYRHIDFGTEKIFAKLGYPTIVFPVNRFFVDPNRKRQDWNSDQGVIINKAWDNNSVYQKKPSKKAIKARLEEYYDPFYRQLQELIQKSSKPVLVLDGHSMDSKKGRPEVGIVNQKHQSCPRKISQIFKNEFENAGYRTRYNLPYWGERANILNFAQEFKGNVALAIELNKKIYMNEQTLETHQTKIRRIRGILKQALKKTEKI